MPRLSIEPIFVGRIEVRVNWSQFVRLQALALRHNNGEMSHAEYVLSCHEAVPALKGLVPSIPVDILAN
jgi:hypothetical protein